ncbi:MAG: hypothetical protein H0U19_05315 [Acidobacteria bacterium]|nr:hypothetical protein [Acidobacteriota bacterium]
MGRQRLIDAYLHPAPSRRRGIHPYHYRSSGPMPDGRPLPETSIPATRTPCPRTAGGRYTGPCLSRMIYAPNRALPAG